MNNYSYNNFANPYMRNYQMPNYGQPQYVQQPQQPMPQPQMQMQQPTQYELPIQYVGNGTLKEAEGYILVPNAKAIFIDRANGMVYEKISNNEGLSSINHFAKVDNNKKVEELAPTPTIDTSNFALKQDLKGFVSINQYNLLIDELNSLKSQISTLNSTPKAGKKNNE